MLQLPPRPTEQEIVEWRADRERRGILGDHPRLATPMEVSWWRDCEQLLMDGLGELTTAEAKALLNRVVMKIEKKAYDAVAAVKVGAV